VTSLITWFYFHAGLNSANSPWYLFWSGIGADWTRLLTAFAFIGGAMHITQRLGRHHTDLLKQRERHHQELLEREK
jgi:hypothetical protein